MARGKMPLRICQNTLFQTKNSLFWGDVALPRLLSLLRPSLLDPPPASSQNSSQNYAYSDGWHIMTAFLVFNCLRDYLQHVSTPFVVIYEWPTIRGWEWPVLTDDRFRSTDNYILYGNRSVAVCRSSTDYSTRNRPPAALRSTDISMEHRRQSHEGPGMQTSQQFGCGGSPVARTPTKMSLK